MNPNLGTYMIEHNAIFGGNVQLCDKINFKLKIIMALFRSRLSMFSQWILGLIIEMTYQS